MPTKTFKIKTEEFDRRGRSMIQHKLRVLLNCYTVYDFSMNEDNSYVFKKSIRRNKIKRNDPKELTGTFSIEKLDESYSLLTLTV